MPNIRILLVSIGWFFAFPAYGHQGVVDSYGCHPNIAHGSYHCHAGPLADRAYPSRAHMIRALKDKEISRREKPKIEQRRY